MATLFGYAAQGVVVEEHVVFSLPELCRACGASSEDVRALVLEGLLQPAGQAPEDWRFSGLALHRARTALRLARELELSWSAAAIVMDLLAEIETLRARLLRGQPLPHRPGHPSTLS
jgi:chaperone modulatory protein CbpM